jgi:hypothetical protein
LAFLISYADLKRAESQVFDIFKFFLYTFLRNPNDGILQ